MEEEVGPWQKKDGVRAEVVVFFFFLEGEGVELGILIKLFRGLRTGQFSSEKVERYQEKYIFFLIPALLFLITANLLKTEEE